MILSFTLTPYLPTINWMILLSIKIAATTKVKFTASYIPKWKDATGVYSTGVGSAVTGGLGLFGNGC